MSAHARSLLLWLATLCLGTAIAAEIPVVVPPPIAPPRAGDQALALSMPELLKLLDRRQEWLMLPLADYHAMVSAGRQHVPHEAGIPAGAWIETATITGQIIDDQRLHLRAELAVVAVAPGASRCRLFTHLPQLLGSATLAGAPALMVAQGEGIDLLVPGPGRHAATITWTVELSPIPIAVAAATSATTSAAGSVSGNLPLPVAAGISVTIESRSPGTFTGAGFAAVNEQQWTLVQPTVEVLSVAWHPGRRSGEEVAAWGVAQVLSVTLADDLAAPRAWQWSATPQLLRGHLPTVVTVRFPAGWIVTGSGGGVLHVTPAADGSVLLSVNPAVGSLQLDGVAPAESPLALPTVVDARWQGGRVVVTNAEQADWILPARWQRLALRDDPVDGPAASKLAASKLLSSKLTASSSYRAFSVPGPDAGLLIVPTSAVAGVTNTTTTLLAIGASLWRLETRIIVQAGSTDLFTLPIQLPSGWRAISATCSLPARIAGADAGGALSETPADGVLQIALPNGLTRAAPAVITIVLERDPPGSAPTGSEKTPIQSITPPVMRGTQRQQHRMTIVGAPNLELEVTASGWQRATDVALPATTAARTVRTIVNAVGEAPPLTVTVRAKPAVCEADVVAWLLPLSGGGETLSGTPASTGAVETVVWCRLDLRLTVSDGELDSLLVNLPLLPDTIQLSDPTVALVRDGERTVLHASQPWRGERLLRIEGRLAIPAGPRIAFPQLKIARIDGQAVPMTLHVAVQAPERLDLKLEPGAAAHVEDEDDVPHWSQAIPGEPLAGVWRFSGSESATEMGGFVLVSRPLVDPPIGFVHHVQVLSQVTAERMQMLVRFRLAAPGLTALPLQLPPGVTLLAATVDGRATAVRRAAVKNSATDSVIPLPGRTQVDIALLCEQPLGVGSDMFSSAVLELELPGLGGLPVTTMSWKIATDVGWLVTPLSGAEVLQLAPLDAVVAHRPWYGTWRDARGRIETETPPQLAIAQKIDEDPRRLAVPTTHVEVAGEPTLALAGQVWKGERIGGHPRVKIAVQPLNNLRRADHVGAALAILVGLWLAWRLRPLTALMIAGAALAGAYSLHTAMSAQITSATWSTAALSTTATGYGPLLAGCEWLAPVVVAAVLMSQVAAWSFFRRAEMAS